MRPQLFCVQGIAATESTVADWAYQSYILYSEAGNSINYTSGDGVDEPGTLTDNTGDTEFDIGEELFVGETSVGTYYGSYTDSDSNVYLIVATGENVGIIYSTLDATTTESELPNNISTDDVNDTDPIPVCFLPGTLIATPDGEVRIETLQIGDVINSHQGSPIPIRWIGRQTVQMTLGPAERMLPVRVRAGALDHCVPHTDLDLTADHGLMLDGLLCNAGALVNGTTIHPIPKAELGERYVVYHIEVDDHQLIIANGVPAETFLDNATRRTFDNYCEYVERFGETEGMQMLAAPRVLSRQRLPARLRDRLDQRALALAAPADAAA